MYEKHWNLEELPFENTTDPRFFFQTPQHSDAAAKLLYAIRGRKGAGMLSGTFGCGKTLVGKLILRQLDIQNYKTAFVINPQLTDMELLKVILFQLGVTQSFPSKAELLNALGEILINNHNDGKHTLIIIDEAHVIEDRKIFEELRMLLNFQMDEEFLLTLLLLGQPELVPKVENIKQLDQRIAVKCHLTNMNKDETKGYILHRLNVAKATQPIFTEPGMDLVYERSGGIPRRINQICDMGMFTAYTKKVLTVDEPIIKEALQNLGQVDIRHPAPEITPVTPLSHITEPRPVTETVSHQPSAAAKIKVNIDDPDSRELYHNSLILIENIFNRIEKKEELDLHQIEHQIQRLVQKLKTEDDTLMVLVQTNSYPPEKYLPYNGVNDAILSFKIGLALNYSDEKLRNLGIAALLHDVGMLKLMKEVCHPGPLTAVEQKEMKKHPDYSVEILKNIKGIDEEVLDTVRQHHERQTGQGYYETKGTEINELAQLLGLVDTYESLTHPRTHRQGFLPDEAMKKTTAISGSHFKPHLIRTMVNEITFYPVGTMVRLSTDEIGRVIKVNRGSPLAPIVEVIIDSEGKRLPEPKQVNLTEETMMHVKSSIDPNQIVKVKRSA